MKKKHGNQPKVISNRRARFDYELGDVFVVGIVLTGAETKAVRLGHAQLRGSYVTVKDSAKGGELWLVNATISPSYGVPIDEADQTRSRKLLAKRKEIDKMQAAKQQGLTIIPTEMLTSSRYIKLRISLGRGKKRYDKRQVLKRKDELRQINRVTKN